MISTFNILSEVLGGVKYRELDYRISAKCKGPRSPKDLRIIGGLNSAGDRLGSFKPTKGVVDKNKERLLIWEEKHLDMNHKDLIEKYQDEEKRNADSSISGKTTFRNFLIGVVVVSVLVFIVVMLLG